MLFFTVWSNFYSFHFSLPCCGISTMFLHVINDQISFLCSCNESQTAQTYVQWISVSPSRYSISPLLLCHLNIRRILENFHYPLPFNVPSYVHENSGMFHFSHPFPIPLLIPWGILPYFYPLEQLFFFFSDRYNK